MLEGGNNMRLKVEWRNDDGLGLASHSHWSRAETEVVYISGVLPAVPVLISVFPAWFSPRK